MSYEFKRLSDVEVVAEPAESANVLIEEDGVIKKAPKTAVGGAGGEWDMIIDAGSAYTNYANFVIESGSYDAIKAKFDEGELPRVMLKYTQEYGDVFYHRVSAHRVMYGSGDYMYLFFMVSTYSNNDNASLLVGLSSDNAFTTANSAT